MASQAFFYNAIFFTYALILTDFYGIASAQVGWYILPFAAGNFLGPLILGRLFDTIGRRPMIAATYIASGVLLALCGYLFAAGVLTAGQQTLAWSVIFFFASAAASSAYLTVSETFPLEIRALAIAIFYAVGTGIGGIVGPWLFGVLIDTGSRMSVFGGYLLGAALMVAAGAVAAAFAVPGRAQAAGNRRPAAVFHRPSAGGRGAGLGGEPLMQRRVPAGRQMAVHPVAAQPLALIQLMARRRSAGLIGGCFKGGRSGRAQGAEKAERPLFQAGSGP